MLNIMLALCINIVQDSATSESGEPASPGDSGQSGAGDSADGTGPLPVENAIFSVYNNG